MMTVLWSFLVLAGAPAERPKDEYLYLSTYFDADAFAAKGAAVGEGSFDAQGRAFPVEALGAGPTFTVRSSRDGDVVFVRPPVGAGEKNAITPAGQKIRVRTRNRFNVLLAVGASHGPNGALPAPAAWGSARISFSDESMVDVPIGFSDWVEEPIFGEEVAVEAKYSAPESTEDALAGGPVEAQAVRLYLQRIPLPADRIVVAITLPKLPSVKLVALTLAHRDAVAPLCVLPAPAPGPAPGPAPVAVFSEPGFPALGVPSGVTPEAVLDRLEKAGIRSARLRLTHLVDPAVFTARSFPVLVQPYGGAFPAAALEALRAFRGAGGAMVHCGEPFAASVEHNPFTGWVEVGDTAESIRARRAALRLPVFGSGVNTRFGPTPALVSWGLGGLPWPHYMLRGAGGLKVPGAVFSTRAPIEPGAEVRAADQPELVPLVQLGSWDSYLALVLRHRSIDVKGAIDVIGPTAPIWREDEREDSEPALEILVRGAAWCLKEKGQLSEEEWNRVTRPPELAEPGGDASIVLPLERPFDSPARPEKLSGKVRWVDLTGVSDAEGVLFASLQGQLAAAAKSLFLARSRPEKGWLDFLVTKKSIEGVEEISRSAALDLLGHRRAVVVDPEVSGALNVATMVAALEGFLVAYPGHVETYRLEVAADLRGTFRDEVDVLAWSAANLAPRLNPALLACVPPEPSTWPLRDYLIRQRAFIVWLAPPGDDSTSTAVAMRDIVRGHLLRVPLLTPVVGAATPDELVDRGQPRVSAVALDATETFFARHGMRWLSVARAANLSLYERIEPRGRTKRPAAPRALKAEPGKVYVALIADTPQGAGLWSIERSQYSRGAGVEDGTIFLDGVPNLVPGGVSALSLPGGLERLSAAHWDAVRDGFGDEVAAMGLALPASLDLGCFGSALGGARKDAVAHLVRSAGAEVSRRGLAYLHLHPSAHFDPTPWRDALRSLPARTAVFYVHDPGAGPRDLLSASTLVGDVPVFHDPGPGLRDLLSSPTLDAYTPLLPALVMASTTSFAAAGAAGAATLGERVVVVRPDELVALSRELFARRRVEAADVVPSGARWKYSDKGTDLGAAWRNPSYDDAAWPEGKAELGYGDAAEGRPEATLLSFGDNPRSKHPTYYFRRAFDVERRADWKLLMLEVLADDGAIVYLNGEEVYRANMPADTVAFGTFANSALASGVETAWGRKALAIGSLREGKNTLAVEVHQSDYGSSDLSFDLRLAAYRWRAVDPAESPAQDGK